MVDLLLLNVLIVSMKTVGKLAFWCTGACRGSLGKVNADNAYGDSGYVACCELIRYSRDDTRIGTCIYFLCM